MIPDFQGPTNAFGVGRLAGHMSQDAVRATLASGISPLSSRSKVMGYGYSDGSHPFDRAASLQLKYPWLPCSCTTPSKTPLFHTGQRSAEHWGRYQGNVTFVTNPGAKASYATEEPRILKEIMRFVVHRFEGQPFSKGLTLRTDGSKQEHRHRREH